MKSCFGVLCSNPEHYQDAIKCKLLFNASTGCKTTWLAPNLIMYNIFFSPSTINSIQSPNVGNFHAIIEMYTVTAAELKLARLCLNL